MWTCKPVPVYSPTKPAGASRRLGWLAVVVSLVIPVQAAAVDSAFLRSLLIPGVGQAHQGHYARAAVYAGSAVLSGFGLLVSQVYYNEAVDKYRGQQRLYASYSETLSEGGVVSIEDIRNTYAKMQMEYNAAEDRLVWRNTLLAAFVAAYTINIVDVLISKPHQVDKDPAVSLEIGPGSLRVTKAFRF